jgi:hypothetical protein
MQATDTRDSPSAQTAPTGAGRSLVPVGPEAVHAQAGCRARPSATFLAQLIATAQMAPQTRMRCRTGPDQAAALYAAAAARAPAAAVRRPT